MERKIVILIIMVSLLFTGCLVNNEDYTSEIESQQEVEDKDVEISGSFVVTIRDIIPDYCLDDFTPQVAVVTQFQSRPFTVYIGEKLASEIDVGKTYVFTIETKKIGKINKEKLQQSISTIVALEEYNIEVANVRLANEEEIGISSLSLKYSIID